MCIGMANGGKQNHIADDGKMMSKMTDEQIIKALEEHYQCVEKGYSDHIANGGKGDEHEEKYIDMLSGSLDLINRQQAEIEWKTTYMHSLQLSMEEIKPQIKSEAIKEFEVKIHEKLHQAEMHGNFEPTLTREMLDSIFKEMVGEGK
jgi:hypothetical protein